MSHEHELDLADLQFWQKKRALTPLLFLGTKLGASQVLDLAAFLNLSADHM